MDKLTLNVEKRDLTGRKVKKLRKEGIVPANIFGKKVKSVSVQADAKTFEKIFINAGETQLVELTLDKEKKPVLVHHVQRDPVTDQLLHIDFLQVDLTQKVTANVPVELVNESPAEKQGIGTAVQQINEIEVEALPADLPEKFEVDLSELAEVDQMVLVKDLKVDRSKVEITNSEDDIVVKVEPPKEEKEEPVATPAEGEEGPTEAPAEGEEEKGEGESKEASE